METSESIKEIASAIRKFQSKMEPLELDTEVEVKGINKKTGKEYKYNFKYATLRNIIEKTRKLLSENELSFTQPVGEGGSVTTLLMHSSGEWIKDTVLIASSENSPQAIGSSISYAKRYSLVSMLGLVAEQDDDANIAEGNQYEVKDTPKKQDERPWLSEQAYNKALEHLKKEGEIFVEDEGMMTREGFVKYLKEKFRMKRIYKEGIDFAIKMRVLTEKAEINGNTKQDTDIPY